MTEGSQQKRVIVVGAGWAGLGATYQLAKQGYDVTLLEAPTLVDWGLVGKPQRVNL